MGAIIEKPCFYEHLTGEENLSIIAKGCHEDFDIVKNVLNIVHLEEHKNKIYENYSLGMKQRLGIAASIITSPDILLLDEPTNGLDPIGILEIRGLINDLSKMGCTLILASHLLAEVDQVCSHIALLKEGKLLFEGSREKFLGDNLIENAFLKIIN